ncbi:hypothetical protein KEG38_11095 [Polyangium jinanense]|uniref:DUF5682 family protein n=1 Tax=Polyangium jinanense TaxID=2829994 RepID=UPI002340C176|nr:DUF5682 family protein [Polyangium jinanense]MDC3954398.1 hypothetical protein [Polyangium jinanense]
MAARKANPGAKAVVPGKTPPTTGPLARIFGVRHLSPMGAWHVERFLDEVDPTAVLVEGPSDATDEIAHLLDKRTTPPVALLAFTQERPVRSVLFPLAAYSPEWVALRWALQKKRVARFIDLAASVYLARSEPAPEHAHEDEDESEEADEKQETDTQRYLGDPYEAIAELSGDPDHDTWWERHFEHSMSPDSYRLSIFELGRELRALEYESPRRREETLLREAFMRRRIRDTIAEGHDPDRIVVICGAYHAPVLVAEEPAMTDEEIEKLPTVPVTRTLMPYSFFRLSSQSGYGAGNKAPGYFQALYEEAQAGSTARLGTRFLAEVAGKLRKAGMVRSSAEVIEAVRLAEGMASLRDAHAPTLRDLEDAAATCLGQGEPLNVARFIHDVAVGDALGKVPPGVLRTSIQDDFYRWVKDLRLEEYLKDKEQIIKGSTSKDWLDLRQDRFAKSEDAAYRDRNRSIFLHRLTVLGIGFAANRTSEEDRAQSTYKEVWGARWTPDCEIQLVENALRGDTIEIAAARSIGEALEAAANVHAAANLARRSVECDLSDATAAALARVSTLAVDDGDFVAVAGAALELSHLVAYKDVRKIDVAPLEPLVAQLFLRGALLAPEASRCNEEASRNVGVALGHLHRVGHMFPDKLDVDRFASVLDAIADDDVASAHVAGVASAILLERGILKDDVLDRRISRRICPGVSPSEGAGFFEGLATRNRYALLSRRSLWAAMSTFVEAMDHDDFRRAVVALRRAFGSFETSEARKIAALLAELWGGSEKEILRAIETKVDDAELAALQDDLGDLDLDL